MEEDEEPAASLVDLLQATAKEQQPSTPDLTSEAATDYLDQLLALPLHTLLAEASVISAEAGSVESELTNLCYREYPTFISVHKCSSAVTAVFDDFSDSLGRLIDAVPALEEECRTFVRSTAGVQNARAKAALVQEHQDKLFDLLEIPQLMDTCVRNGYYQEALELSAHTHNMVERYPNVELVHDVSKEVDGVLQLMLSQLLALLREPITLPALIKTVGYLRRLGTIGESELSLVFLISRLSNFKGHLVGLERDRTDPVRYVRKYIDLFRGHIFDIVSQFSAIFLEGTPSPSAASQLSSFVGQCVDDLVTLVSNYVPKMANDAASLSSILVQLGYCSLAFARVGLDFAPLITEPFSDTVLLSFKQTIGTATSSLTGTLQQAIKSAGSPSQVLMAQEYLSSLMASDSPLGFIKWDGGLEHLPTDLARFPPLAILVNGHLQALNSLRLLAPLHLHPRLAAAQAAALVTSTHAVAQYVRQTVALSAPLVDASPDRPGHKRANSTGKAALLRRNSEGQLTPEARTAKRRETQWVCIAFADTWTKVVCPLLASALNDGIFEGAMKAAKSEELVDALHSLSTWVDDQLNQHVSPLSPAKRNGTLGANGGSETPLVIHEEEHVAEPEEITEEVLAQSPTKEGSATTKSAAVPVAAAVAAAATVAAVVPELATAEGRQEEPATGQTSNGTSRPTAKASEDDPVVPVVASTVTLATVETGSQAEPAAIVPPSGDNLPDVVSEQPSDADPGSSSDIPPAAAIDEPDTAAAVVDPVDAVPNVSLEPPADITLAGQLEAKTAARTSAIVGTGTSVTVQPVEAPGDPVAVAVDESPVTTVTASGVSLVTDEPDGPDVAAVDSAVGAERATTEAEAEAARVLEPEPEPVPPVISTPAPELTAEDASSRTNGAAVVPTAPAMGEDGPEATSNDVDVKPPATSSLDETTLSPVEDVTEPHADAAAPPAATSPEPAPAPGAAPLPPPADQHETAPAAKHGNLATTVPEDADENTTTIHVPGDDLAHVSDTAAPAALVPVVPDVAFTSHDAPLPDTNTNKVNHVVVGDGTPGGEGEGGVLPALIPGASSEPVPVDVDQQHDRVALAPTPGTEDATPAETPTDTPAGSEANSRAPSPTPSAAPSTGGGGGAKKKKKKKGKKK